MFNSDRKLRERDTGKTVPAVDPKTKFEHARRVHESDASLTEALFSGRVPRAKRPKVSRAPYKGTKRHKGRPIVYVAEGNTPEPEVPVCHRSEAVQEDFSMFGDLEEVATYEDRFDEICPDLSSPPKSPPSVPISPPPPTSIPRPKGKEEEGSEVPILVLEDELPKKTTLPVGGSISWYMDNLAPLVLNKMMNVDAESTIHPFLPLRESSLRRYEKGEPEWDAYLTKLFNTSPWYTGKHVEFQDVVCSSKTLVQVFNAHLEHVSSIIGVSYVPPREYSLFDMCAFWTGVMRPSAVHLWALSRCFTILSGDEGIRSFEGDLRTYCAESLPVKFVSQANLFSIVLDKCNIMLNNFGDVLGIGFNAIMSAIVKVFSTARTAINAMPERLFDLVIQGARDKITEVYNQTNDFLTQLINSPTMRVIVKVLIRTWMGYSPIQQVIELMFDNTVSLALHEIFSSFCDAVNAAYHAEAISTTVYELIVKLGVASGVAATSLSGVNVMYIVNMARQFSTLATACDKAGLNTLVGTLENYFSGVSIGEEQRTRCQIIYPQVFEFCQIHEVLAPKDIHTRGEMAALGASFAAFNESKKAWQKEDIQYLTLVSTEACIFARKVGAAPSGKARRAPHVFCMAGEPGMGKSTMIAEICRIFAMKLGEPVTDLIYTVNAVDKYDSGYMNQLIWRFDDLFQKLDSQAAPSPDVELLFRLCTSNPLVLNKADVDSKGCIGQCHVALAATNVLFEQGVTNSEIIRPHIKSVMSPTGLRRRLTHIVIPKLNKGFYLIHDAVVDEEGNEVLGKVPTEVLFHFVVLNRMDQPRTGDLPEDKEGHRHFSWAGLLELIASSYMENRDYVPAKVREKDLEAVGILEPQGNSPFSYASLVAMGIGGIAAGLGARYYNSKSKYEGYNCPCTAAPGEEIPGLVFPTDKCYRSVEALAIFKKVNMAQNLIELDGSDECGEWYSTVPQPYCRPVFLTSPAGQDAPGSQEYPTAEGFYRMPTHTVGVYRIVKCETVYIVSEPCVLHNPINRKYKQWAQVLAGLAICAVVTTVHQACTLYATCGSELWTFDKQKQVYTAEADGTGPQKMEYEGKMYVLTKTKQGYRYYPEAGTSPDLESFLRIKHAAPSLADSLFSIVSSTGVLIGNGFALSQTTLLLPGHVVDTMVVHGVVTLKRDKCSYGLHMLSGQGYKRHVVGNDMEILEWYHKEFGFPALLKCRKQKNKLCRNVPSNGQATLYRRDAQGELIVAAYNYTSADDQIIYPAGGKSVVIPPANARHVTAPSVPGWCGGFYMHTSSTLDAPVIGFHVAGTPAADANKLGVMEIVGKQILSFEPTVPPSGLTAGSRSYVAHGGNGSKMSTGEELDEKGFNGWNVDHYEMYYPDSTKDYSTFYRSFSPPYALARLRPFLGTPVDGITPRIDPLNNALAKLASKKAEAHLPRVSLMELAAEIGKYVKPFELGHDRSWPEALGVGELPSTKRGSSAGYPYRSFGGAKGFMFQDMESVVPTADACAWLDKMRYKLVPRDFDTKSYLEWGSVPSENAACIKDEPLPIAKVIEGLSRLYVALSAHEFSLERMVFYDVAVNFQKYNLLYSSAVGIDPGSFGVIHDHLMSCEPDRIMAGDFRYMDGSFLPEDGLACCNFWFSLMGANIGPTRFVPQFGQLDRRKMEMYVLVKRLMNFRMVYRDAVFVPGVSHPSGSFLTTILNITMQKLLWTYAFKVIFNTDVPTVMKWVKMVFLGDDSLVAISRHAPEFVPRQISELFLKCGFTITDGEDKTKAPRFFKPYSGYGVSEYTFLSRHFANVGGEIRGTLIPKRLVKTICFTNLGKEIDNMPDQMLSFFDELQYYPDIMHPEYVAFLQKTIEVLNSRSPGMYEELLSLFKQKDFVSFRLAVLKVISPPVYEAQAGGSDTQESLGGNTGADTTTFVENVVEDETHAQDLLDEFWRQSGMESASHAESEILGRPHVIADFLWNAVTPESAFLGYFPGRYFYNNFNAQAKLTNYAFIQCTVCLRVVISSSPYAAGKLLLHTRPLGLLASSNTMASGDPSVELDASSGKTAVIRIPYVAPHNFAFIERFSNGVTANPEFDWCSIGLRVLSPIAQVGTANVNVKIFSWLEDVHLRGPTFTAWSLSAQGGGVAMETESGVLKTMSSAAKVIKTIGGVAVETGVLVAKGAAALAVVGLSKPPMADNTTSVMELKNFGAAHFQGRCPAIRLAGSQLQKVTQPMNSFSIGVDEMDIAHYTSRLGFFKSITWDAAVLSETTLASIRVSPGLFVTASSNRYFLPMSAVAAMFRFWRGTMRYRFALAKTRFHGGVIEILYQPGVNDYTITADRQATICYRAVWDIQESSSIEIDVPFCCPVPWATVALADQNAGVTNETGSPTGYLHVRVLNPLVTAQDLVTDSLEILVFVGCGKDIEFALPCLYTTSLSTPEASKKPGRKFQPQSGGGVFQKDATDGLGTSAGSLTMFQATPPSQTTLFSCVGESIPNMRMLTRRFGKTSTITSTGRNYSMQGAILTNPYMFFMSYMFAFATGGFRLQVRQGSLTNITEAYLEYLSTLRLEGLPEIIFEPGSVKVIDVPYYHQVPFLYSGALRDIANYFPVDLFIGGASTTYNYSYASADDFSYGWQVGPGLTVPAVNSVGTLSPPYLIPGPTS